MIVANVLHVYYTQQLHVDGNLFAQKSYRDLNN